MCEVAACGPGRNEHAHKLRRGGKNWEEYLEVEDRVCPANQASTSSSSSRMQREQLVNAWVIGGKRSGLL